MNTMNYEMQKSEIDPKYGPTNLSLSGYDYSGWCKELDDLLSLQGNEEEEVKVEEGLKFLSPNKLLTRLPIV